MMAFYNIPTKNIGVKKVHLQFFAGYCSHHGPDKYQECEQDQGLHFQAEDGQQPDQHDHGLPSQVTGRRIQLDRPGNWGAGHPPRGELEGG